MRWWICAAAWVVAVVAALAVAANTRVGPVVVTLSPRHGLHLGDVVAVLVGVAVASVVSVVAFLTSPAPPPAALVVRWVVCAAVWMLALLTALYVAMVTEWGPVVLRVSPYHGVHLGDVVAVLVGVAVAGTVTAVAVATSPRRPGPPAAPARPGSERRRGAADGRVV